MFDFPVRSLTGSFVPSFVYPSSHSSFHSSILPSVRPSLFQFVRLLVYSAFLPFVCSFPILRPSVRPPFFLSICSFVPLFLLSLFRSSVSPSIHRTFVRNIVYLSFVCPFVPDSFLLLDGFYVFLFGPSLVHFFIRLFDSSFICLFMHLFFCSFSSSRSFVHCSSYLSR